MKFNDKIVKLRKEKMLTQEELAEKLDVTRQTISKWELGQTVPDKDELIKLSQIFNVSIDEMLDESEKVQEKEVINEQLDDSNKTKKRIFIAVGIVILFFVIAYVIFFGIFNAIKGKIDDTTRQSGGIISSIINKGKEMESKLDQEVFFDNYSGEKSGSMVKDAISKVINNNAKGEHLITVKYNEITATSSDELVRLMQNINKSKYIVTYDYGTDGYISTMKIVDAITDEDTDNDIDAINDIIDAKKLEMEISSFNFTFSNTGLNSKFMTEQAIKKVITSNMQNERKVTVKYGKTNAVESTELTSLISKLNKSEYLISYEYDEYGFVNLMNIANV